MKTFNRTHLVKLILTALLIALNIIFERLLAYSVWNQTISFSFVTVAFAASFLGAPYAVAVAAIGDIIGSILIPFGPYFPGFTLSNALIALCTAIFIHKNATVLRIGCSILINKIFGSLLLNTLWITILYRDSLEAFPAVFVSRIPQSAIMAVVEFIVLIIVFAEKSKLRINLDKTVKKYTAKL